MYIRRPTIVPALLVLAAGPAYALYLDHGRNFEFRARMYSEAVVAAEDSQPQTRPARDAFDVISHRNFINPEFEARLGSYLPFKLDDFSFRLALWGFYDGIYEYGAPQYDESRQSIQGRISQGHTKTAPVTRNDTLVDSRKLYTYQPDPVLGNYNDPGERADLPFRINEAYLNFAKGPVFVRVGRQTISWGESDSIALLDLNNPFNLTLSQPGLFQDVDEARIPLWTLRGTYNLFDSWKWLSSAFVEGYLVPGSIDTTVSQLPIPLASPYSPPQGDPQALIAGLIPPDIGASLVEPLLGRIQLSIYDHLPSRKMSNSRFGVRFGGVVARDYTASVWYYRTFAGAPVPRFLPLDLSRAPLTHPGDARFTGPTQIITEIRRDLVDVIGGATSFFSAPLNGIIRSEIEFFKDEPAFIPSENIPFQVLLRTPALRRILNGVLGQDIPAGRAEGRVPTADMLRFELGYDRFFFFRKLNPANSFIWVTAYVGQANLSEIAGKGDYRFYGQQKLCKSGDRTCVGTRVGANTQGLNVTNIGKLRTVDTDFVDLYPYESFVQTHLQTDYMHGRLTPAITAIIGLNGTFAVPVGVTYRFTDNVLFDFKYIYTGGAFTFPTGLFRDRSQLSGRITLLLN